MYRFLYFNRSGLLLSVWGDRFLHLNEEWKSSIGFWELYDYSVAEVTLIESSVL